MILGPEGVGTIAQLGATQALLVTLCNLGMGIGIRRYAAQYKAEADSRSYLGENSSLAVETEDYLIFDLSNLAPAGE